MNVYQNQMKSACKLALDQLSLKFEEQVQYVFNMIGLNCSGRLLEHAVIQSNVPDRSKRDRELFSRLEQLVKSSPRGAFAIVERQFSNNPDLSYSHSTFQTIVSDGTGQVANGGRFNSYSVMPTFDSILNEMVGNEIRDCMHVVKIEQKIAENLRSIRDHQLKVGQSFSNFVRTDNSVKYSVAKIKKIDRQLGNITISASRKGRVTFEDITMPAAIFVACTNLKSSFQSTIFQEHQSTMSMNS